MGRVAAERGAGPSLLLDTHAFLESAGLERTLQVYAKGSPIFRQGDLAEQVLYIQSGTVKLSVVSKTGREGVVAVLGAGDFFGEGCLAGQTIRIGSASAITACTIVGVAREHMEHLLHNQHELSDRFIAHMLARNIRFEEDLIDQLFNSSEKRLARTLLLLARYGKQDTLPYVVPRLSQETLAEMVGTTRSRVNFFLNKFKALGLIDYDGTRPITINNSLLSVILHD